MISVDGQPMDWYPGITVAQILERLEDGHIYAVVRLNGKLISRPSFTTAQVPDNATLEPIPMVAGG